LISLYSESEVPDQRSIALVITALSRTQNGQNEEDELKSGGISEQIESLSTRFQRQILRVMFGQIALMSYHDTRGARS
jgi:phage-related protein